MKKTFEQEMDAANDIGSAMIKALAQKMDGDKYQDYPDAIAVYASVFCLVDVAHQVDAKLPWVLELVKDVYKNSRSNAAVNSKFVM